MGRKTFSENSKVDPSRRIHGNLTYENFEEAIALSGGFISSVADSLGLSITVTQNVMDKFLGLRRMFYEQRERVKDNVENLFIQKIYDKQDTNAMIFYLRTQGRDRGYVEKDDGKKKGKVKIKMVPAKDRPALPETSTSSEPPLRLVEKG